MENNALNIHTNIHTIWMSKGRNEQDTDEHQTTDE